MTVRNSNELFAPYIPKMLAGWFTKRYFILIIILIIPLTESLFSQLPMKQWKQKSVVLNPLQIDFMERLDFDLRTIRIFDTPGGHIVFMAYGGNDERLSYILKRRSAGLRDRSNLPAVIHELRDSFKGYSAFNTLDHKAKVDMHATTMQGLIFFSLTVDECSDLLQMTDKEIQVLANKYADYLQQLDAKSEKINSQIKKLPKY